MATAPVSPGPVFCFAAFVLLLVVSLSTPIWNEVSFLNTTLNDHGTRFGVFGFTGTKIELGYAVGYLHTKTDIFASTALRRLSYFLILHPIGAGLSLLATIFGVCGFTVHRSGAIASAMLAAIAGMVAMGCLVIDLILFSVVRKKLQDEGYSAEYGNAIWMTIGAVAALLVGFCTSVCGVFGRFRSPGRRSSIVAYQKG